MALNMNSVVLAEDDPEISSMVKDYFEQVYGLSVTTTDKVDEIIPLVLKTKASVLIMDLELKDGDASQVVSDVAGIDGLVVIILTGTWKGREENKLLKDGAQVVMRKPQKPSTIWQQVLNLRGVAQKKEDAPPKIFFKSKKGYYDLQEGLIIKEGGQWIYLTDQRRDIMEILVDRMVQDNKKSNTLGEGAWVIRGDLITNENLGKERVIPEDVWRALRYNINKIIKTLEEILQIAEGIKPIEKSKAGRDKSFYRLNPEVFQLANPEDAKGEG